MIHSFWFFIQTVGYIQFIIGTITNESHREVRIMRRIKYAFAFIPAFVVGIGIAVLSINYHEAIGVHPISQAVIWYMIGLASSMSTNTVVEKEETLFSSSEVILFCLGGFYSAVITVAFF
jgi:energy-converting hydrogenase Eha subunit A